MPPIQASIDGITSAVIERSIASVPLPAYACVSDFQLFLELLVVRPRLSLSSAGRIPSVTGRCVAGPLEPEPLGVFAAAGPIPNTTRAAWAAPRYGPGRLLLVQAYLLAGKMICSARSASSSPSTFSRISRFRLQTLRGYIDLDEVLT